MRRRPDRPDRRQAKHAGDVAALAFCALVPWLTATPATAQRDDPRKLWAYPSGVIVTTTIPGLSRIKSRLLRTELEAFGAHVEPEFSACLAEMRTRRADLKGGPRVALVLEVNFRADGHIASIHPERRPTPELVECTVRAMIAAQSFRVTPLTAGSPGEGEGDPAPQSDKDAKDSGKNSIDTTPTVRLALDGVMLTDDEAKGKGFLFYEAETRWEQDLRAHPEWQRCTQTADCTTVVADCTVHGVNQAHASAFAAALAGRQAQRTCAEPPTPQGVSCVKRHCVAK